MAGQGQQLRHHIAPGADDLSDDFSTGQAQLRRPHDFVNQPSHPQGGQGTNPGQGTNFLHQTGEQMKNMAQGAADAVKNTLGMNTNGPHHSNTTGTNSAGQYGSSGIGTGPAGAASTGYGIGGAGTGTGYGSVGGTGTGINHPSNRNAQI